MLKKLVILMTFINLAQVSAFNLEDAKNQLTDQEMAQIGAGKLVLTTKHINGAAWPKVLIYGKIKATPLQAVAIYLALDHQSAYVPNVIRSQVVKQLSPKEVLTKYEMHMPFPIPNSKYTHGSDFHKFLNGRGYRAKWWLIKSSAAAKVEGDIFFLNDGAETFFVYSNFVKPKSFFARFFKKTMLKDTQNSLEKIRDYIELCVRSKPEILNKYVKIIEDSLKGKYVYRPQDGEK